MKVNLTEGSTWRGGIRLVSGGVAALVLFSGGDPDAAQAAGAGVAEQLVGGVEGLQTAYAMVVLIVGEAVKALVGLFKSDSSS